MGQSLRVPVESAGSAHRASDAECGRQARDLCPGGHRDPPGNSRGCLNDPKDCAAVKTVTLPRCPEEDVETKVLSTEAEVRANETRIPQTGRLWRLEGQGQGASAGGAWRKPSARLVPVPSQGGQQVARRTTPAQALTPP